MIIQQEQLLKPYLKRALIIHVGGFALLYALSVVGKFNFFNIQKSKVDIIEDSVKVDVVAMPTFTLQELKKMDINLANEAEVKSKKEGKDVIKKNDIVYKKKGGKKKFSDLLNKYSKRKLVKEKKKVKEKPSANEREIRKLILEGNKVSKGSRLVGTYSEEEQNLYSQYVNNLPNTIRPNWTLPSYLLDQGLNCRIRVFIDQNGSLLKMQIQESSGNDEYDQKVQDAIRASSPFPMPESVIANRLIQSGIILGFPL